MANKLLNIGIVGCGPIAQFAHFEACQKGKNVQLYAICDLADDLRERMALIWQVPKSYRSYEDMLADPKVEAVIVATADAFHVPLALQAIQAGKHVLVEKPLGTQVSECLALQEALSSTHLKLQVGHMKRFDPGISFAKQFIEKEMGEMLAYKAWYCDSTYRYTVTDNVQPLAYKSEAAKKPNKAPKSNLEEYYLLAHGSHLLDTARYLAGEIKAVRARLSQKFGAWCWFIETAFEQDILGHLDLTVAVRMDWHEGFQIYGEKGSVLGKTYNPWYFKSSEVQCFSEADGQYHQPLAADGHFYRRQLEAFAEAVLEDKPVPGTDIKAGIASVKAIEAILQSVRTGAWVHLNEINPESHVI